MYGRRDTKREIFNACAELFAERGFASVSTKDIAEKVGIQQASIYSHYKSKDDILNALLDYYLERMEGFYEKFRVTGENLPENPRLEDLLENLMLSYEPDEQCLMFLLTRIVHHEQFTSPKAADALVGSGYRKYVAEHEKFFDRLSDAGLIKGKERNRYYAELFTRISLTFATQFLHPDIEPTMYQQSEMYRFLIPIIIEHESRL